MAETIEKKPIRAPEVLNEAFHYERPSSFSRGLRLDFGSVCRAADLRDGQHRDQWGDAARRRLSRPDPAHVPQHHRAARGRRRNLA